MLERRTPLKRTRLSPMSSKRRDENARRRGVMDFVRSRDRVCQFWPFVVDHFSGLTPEQFRRLVGVRRCHGPLAGHEPAHSRNVGRLNPDEIVLACQYHNGLAEDEPELCRLVEWTRSANGVPIRKWQWSLRDEGGQS